MTILNIAILAFMLLELANVLALYFNPTMKQANGVGMFKAWDKSKKDKDLHDFVQYLVYWIAGSKLIFIMLLGVVLLLADPITKYVAVGVLIVSIATFYWKLYPLISSMDKKGEIVPKGYSKTLAVMIFIFILVLSISLLYSLYSTGL